MRKLVVVSIFILTIVILGSPVFAQAGVERITSYTTDVTINTDGTIDVNEEIIYNTGLNDRRGIIRNVFTDKTNEEGKRFRLDISDIQVTDENGNEMETKITRDGSEIEIRVGNASIFFTGEREYNISYKVSGAITYFDDFDELSWIGIPTEWDFPIEKAVIRVNYPPGITVSDITTTCNTGNKNNQTQFCTVADQLMPVTIVATKQINPSTGMDVITKFPKGYVAQVEPQEINQFFENVGGYLLATIIGLAVFIWHLVLPFWIGFRWFQAGRDPYVGKPVSAWFDPPKTKAGRPLTVAETGALIDEKVHPKDVSAQIVDLARRGYLKIRENKQNDFSFIKQKEYKDDTTLQPFEVKLLDGIFKKGTDVRVKDLQLYSTVKKVQDMIYKDMVKENFFPKNPRNVRTFYGSLIGFAVITFNIFLVISAAFFGMNMVRKTLYGAKQANVAKGLKNFLSSQQQQLEFQADKQMMFEKLLPFAIAFGVERTWAKRFEKIHIQPPQWYEGTSMTTFSAISFADSMRNTTNSFNSVASPSSSSSGFSSGFSSGGFSGGGGGGGGSW